MKLDKYGIRSKLFLGTAGYPSFESIKRSIEISKADVLTVSMRRQLGNSGSSEFINFLTELNINILPNTSGCYTADDAVLVAKMARDIFSTNLIKLEVVSDEITQAPNPVELVKAAEALVKDNFLVFPYTSDDLGLANNLSDVGCEILMPGGSPIGSGQGILNQNAIKRMIRHHPTKAIILDAGIGMPSDASKAMEIGCDAVLVNSAIAKASKPDEMSKAFSFAVEAGYLSRNAGPIAKSEETVPSSPVSGLPFTIDEINFFN